MAARDRARLPLVRSTAMRVARRSSPVLLAVALALGPGVGRARAERTLANDTLAMSSTPAALSCGFCVGERFASLYPLEPADLPLDVLDVQLAFGAARVSGVAGSRCLAYAYDGLPRLTRVEVWAGTAETPEPAPGGDGETLVFMGVDVPIVPVGAPEGSMRFDASLTSVPTTGAMQVTDARYLRVVLDVPRPASIVENVCARNGWGDDPDAFPMHDADGLLPHRNAAYSVGGASAGWVWADDLGVVGDWVLRATIQTRGGARPDAGPPADAGTRDAGARDAAAARDASGGADASVRDAAADGGPGAGGGSGGGGCAVAAGGRAGTLGGAVLLAWLLVARGSRRRRRGGRCGRRRV